MFLEVKQGVYSRLMALDSSIGWAKYDFSVHQGRLNPLKTDMMGPQLRGSVNQYEASLPQHPSATEVSLSIPDVLGSSLVAPTFPSETQQFAAGAHTGETQDILRPRHVLLNFSATLRRLQGHGGCRPVARSVSAGSRCSLHHTHPVCHGGPLPELWALWAHTNTTANQTAIDLRHMPASSPK